VRRLIAGGGQQPHAARVGHVLPIVFICDECIGLCSEIIATEPHGDPA
jgi:hypothetical protein